MIWLEPPVAASNDATAIERSCGADANGVDRP